MASGHETIAELLEQEPLRDNSSNQMHNGWNRCKLLTIPLVIRKLLQILVNDHGERMWQRLQEIPFNQLCRIDWFWNTWSCFHTHNTTLGFGRKILGYLVLYNPVTTV